MMNVVSNLLKGLLLGSLFFLVACSVSNGKDGVLDESTVRELVDEKFHGLEGLQEAVSQLYVSAINKDWSSVYGFRDNSIERLVNEAAFVATVEPKMANFAFNELEFQMIEARTNPSGELVTCRVVMRVVQAPYAREHTAVVNWFKESGDWKCDSIGLRGSPLLQ